jgi:hypothetical protein
VTSEEILTRYAVRLALQTALAEAAQPKPIIIPDRMVELPRSEQPCPPARTLH